MLINLHNLLKLKPIKTLKQHFLHIKGKPNIFVGTKFTKKLTNKYVIQVIQYK